MISTLGENLKRLRTARSLTQEEVAGQLGISYQSVSKWERGEGYPDITMLPALAHYFGVSTDFLLGMQDRDAQYKEINVRWQENRKHGLHRENAALMRTALKDFPGDALLLVQLSSSLERIPGTPEECARYLDESIAVQEQILSFCTDCEVRGATLFNICFSYEKRGEHDTALAYAKKLPNLYKARENALVQLQCGEECLAAAYAALEPLAWAVKTHLSVIAAEEGEGSADLRNTAEETARMLHALSKRTEGEGSRV